MNLYEIDARIYSILAALEPDEGTGEIPVNYEELDAQLQGLQMQRFEKLQNVARYALNVRSESAMLKAEEERLNARLKALEKKEKSLMNYLGCACQRRKTDLGVATRYVYKVHGRAQEMIKNPSGVQ